MNGSRAVQRHLNFQSCGWHFFSNEDSEVRETLLLVNNSSDPMISLHRDPDHNPGLCIEKLLNERFELKKSGIAELKLLPLKDRLTRCALLSSRP
jgi:hypothetical protein